MPLSEETLACVPEDIRSSEHLRDYNDLGDVAQAYVTLKDQDWRERYLDEADRGDKLFQDTPDVATLAKRFKDTRSAVLQGVKVPSTESSDSEWDAYHARARPESAEKYEINQPEDAAGWSKPMESWFRDTAFKNGLSQRQAAAMVDSWPEFVNEQSEAAQGASEEALKQQWGDAYEANKALMQRGFKFHSSPEMIAELEQFGLGNSPALAEHFRKLGADLAEDATMAKTGTTTQQPVAAKEEAFAAIERVNGDGCFTKAREAKCAYHSQSHPGHQKAVERYRQAYAIAHGGV